MSRHALVLREDPPPGRLELCVGWYDLRTGERLAVDATPDLRRENATAVVAATTTMGGR